MQSRKMTCLAACLLLAVLPIVSACDYVAGAKKALLANYNTWNGMQDELIKQYKAGLISEADWAKIKALDVKIVAVHNAGLDALKIYEQTKGKTAKEKVIILLGQSMQLIQDGTALYNAFAGGGK